MQASVTEQHHGIHVRSDAKFDKGLRRETEASYGWMDAGLGDLLLDVGANIGTVSKLFSDRGCCVEAYEPEPDNCRMFRMNAPGALLHQVAVVADDQKSITLHMGGSTVTHSLIPSVRKHDGIEVECRNFQAELHRTQPTHVKVDVEGYEYDLVEAVWVPQSVRQMAIEFQFRPKRNTPQRMISAIERLMGQGFCVAFDDLLVDPFNTHKWFTVIRFSRQPDLTACEWWFRSPEAFRAYCAELEG